LPAARKGTTSPTARATFAVLVIPRSRRLLVALIALSGTALLGACAAAAAPRDLRTSAVEVAAGVYMLQGAPGEVDAENLGRTGNAGFIVGETGVIAVDTGTSYRHGLALLASIRRVTNKPVRLVVITHARQEFLFGSAAYSEQGIPIRMHRRSAGLMRSRCERCLKTLNQVLGAEEMQGTAMLLPDQEFDQTHAIDAIGRPVEVLYFGHSSGPGDVAVLDRRTGVLFAGGLLDQLRIPDVQDSDLDGWTRALRALHDLPLRAIVPGHGPLATPAVIDSVERYLAQLRALLLELLAAGAGLSEVPDAAALPEFARWDQYETIHRRNASILFVRFEREQMFRRPGGHD
jgi:glyoxylase-like metal-dependent hydrolase (beta-lactamase superfamily II)